MRKKGPLVKEMRKTVGGGDFCGVWRRPRGCRGVEGVTGNKEPKTEEGGVGGHGEMGEGGLTQ